MESNKVYSGPPLWEITNLETGRRWMTYSAQEAFWYATSNYTAFGKIYTKYKIEPYDSPAARVLYGPKSKF